MTTQKTNREAVELWRRVQNALRRYAQVAIVETDEHDMIIISASYVLARDDVRLYCDRNTRLPDIEWEFSAGGY